MTRVSVAQVLAVCSSTYRTIDVRLAVVRQGGEWVNAFATIRLNHATIATVRRYQKELQNRHGTIRTEQFALLAIALPFSSWSVLQSELSEGILRIGDENVRLSPLNLPVLDAYVRPPHSGWLHDPVSWPAVDFATGEDTSALLNADQVI